MPVEGYRNCDKALGISPFGEFDEARLPSQKLLVARFDRVQSPLGSNRRRLDVTGWCWLLPPRRQQWLGCSLAQQLAVSAGAPEVDAGQVVGVVSDDDPLVGQSGVGVVLVGKELDSPVVETLRRSHSQNRR